MEIPIAQLIRPETSSKAILKFESFLRLTDASFWQQVFSADQLLLDLTGIDILTHDGLACLGYLCLRRNVDGRYTYIRPPDDQRQIDFIRYLGFERLQAPLAFGFIHDLGYISSTKHYKTDDESAHSLRRIQYVTANNWAQKNSGAATYIRTYIMKRLKVAQLGSEDFQKIRPFTETIQELICNVAMHGGPIQDQGVGLAVYTPPPQTFPILRFYCNDLGPGFRQTLQERRDIFCKDDQTAIVRALLYRFNYKAEGILGLYPTLSYIRERNGRIGIKSGAVFGCLDLSDQRTQSKFDSDYTNPSEQWLFDLMRFSDAPRKMGTHVYVDLELF